MNLLITGGAGFIGSNLIWHLAQKREIQKLVNLDCLTYAGKLENLTGLQPVMEYVFEKVDLRNREEVEKVIRSHDITHVIHLAAESHVDRSITGPADFIQTNIVGTFNLLESCRAAWTTSGAIPSAHRYLHVSTDEVFGSLGSTGVFHEDSPYAPNSPYAASKAASDHLVRAHHKTYGLPTLITHSTNNFGPYQHAEKFIPTIIRSIANRTSIPVYGTGSNIRDWLYVTDHCAALWTVLNQGKTGQSYCIGTGNECTNLTLTEALCDIIDELKPELGGNSRRLITFVTDRPGHDYRYAVDSTRIRNGLNWSPVQNFQTALRETVSLYLNGRC